MTLIVRCDDKQRLVSYLYGETSGEEHAAVESHLATCPACAAELASLHELRGQLAGWDAPEAELGFRVTREPAVVTIDTRRSWWPLPAWAQAAAAVLVLSAGAAIANLEIRYGRDGLSVRTGWASQASVTPSRAEDPARMVRTSAGDERWRTALADAERRLRVEFASATLATHGAQPTPVTSRAPASDEVLAKVRALIEESERRQQRELALRVAQVTQDVEAQRRADLVRIEQNLGQIEGLTSAEAARQRDLMNYLVRVSQRR